MSRFSSAAGPGASRTMRALRRAEAQTRQAAEQERDEQRRTASDEPEPLSDLELAELALAAAIVTAVDRVDYFGAYETRTSWWPR